MIIVSIQSQVVYGQAGNTAAVPILQAYGHEVLAVPTALLSNTPHYPSLAGGPLPSDQVEDLLAEILERVPAEEISAVLTGWMGTAETVAVVARFLERVRRRNPAVVYLCDPVMGDEHHGLYVQGTCAEAIVNQLAPLADILTPNTFELARLAPVLGSEAPALLLAVTGMAAADDLIRSEVRCSGRVHAVETIRLRASPTGTGDVFSAAFLSEHLRGATPEQSLRAAVATVFVLVQAAVCEGRSELPIGSSLALLPVSALAPLTPSPVQ